MNTRCVAFAGVVALGVCAVVHGADWVEQRPAYDRNMPREIDVSAVDQDNDPTEPELRFAGRLVTGSGRPLVGLPVEGARKKSYTDQDGWFEIGSDYKLNEVRVLTPSGELYVASEPWFGADELAATDLDTLPPRTIVDPSQPFEARFETLRRLRLDLRGEGVDRIEFSWLDWSRWLPIPAEVLTRVLGKSDSQTLVRATVRGRIDRFVPYPPRNSTLAFDFRNDQPYGLVVVSRGEPVAGARVEVVDVATSLAVRLRRDGDGTPLLLNRAVTDANGHLSLAGDPDGLYVAYVYANGYEPARVRLAPGVDTRVELMPRNVSVRLAGISVGDLLRIKLAGRDSVVHDVRAIDDEPIAVQLAIGVYDATVANAADEIVTGTTFTVGDESLVVDLVPDRSPKVVLTLPERRWEMQEWLVGGTRRTLPHRRVGVFSFLRDWRDFVGGEGPATVESVDDATRVLRFPGTGRWTVHIASPRAHHSLFAELDLAAGEVRELRLPPLNASLEGTMTYEPDPGDEVLKYHWVDGPRMMLIPTGDTTWGVMSYLPRPGRGGREPNTIAVDGLPAGDYHLYHHLADERGWGGREVSIAPGSTTRVEGLGAVPPAGLVVEVVNERGEPVRNRILRIRDRLHKQWHPSAGLVITSGPVDPVPVPPALHLKGEPVTFDSIRAGWLELVVDDPAGDARHFRRKVTPGKTLRLVVDL